MKNEQQILNQIAQNESPIDSKQLLAEILPIIEDYFVGNIKFEGQHIAYEMPNGQIFYITAKIA